MPADDQKSRKKVYLIWPPPKDHETLSCGAIFKIFKLATGLSYNKLVEDLNEAWSESENSDGDESDLGVDAVKRWKDDIVPLRRGAIEEFIRAYSQSTEIADAWWSAFRSAWDRRIQADNQKRSEERSQQHNEQSKPRELVTSLQARDRAHRQLSHQSQADDLKRNEGSSQQQEEQSNHRELVIALQSRVRTDRQLNQLPALFETDITLPLATAYVDLRITPARPIVPMPELLEQRLSLAEKIRRRTEERILPRRPPQDALDTAGSACRLILGAPGSGKSSLLRRLALDIAAGKWTTASVPVFVEARAYAQARKQEPTLTLVEYACRKLGGTCHRQQEIFELLTRLDIPPDYRAILLVDGLDEIASDADAVTAVCSELRDSANGIGWIVTARPAGLVQAVGEDNRYEISELDADSISALVDNWCQATIEKGIPLDATALKEELARVPSIREMSTNPFLLTALCFLKSTARNEALPASRIAVYEKLIARIAHQAQARHGSDRSILSTEALRDLAIFARNLYEGARGARQVFTEDMWTDFVAKTTPRPTTDFRRQIVPARLLSMWSDSDPQYHFLHLTLHEYFVAVAMLDWTVDDALARRFKPAWRTVFRFYGALLWQRGLTKQFAHLTIGLYQSADVNSLSLITLAEIFADAGLRDTTPQLGEKEDLREVLWAAIHKTSDNTVGAEAFVDALAMLDPNWLSRKTQDYEMYLLDVSRRSISAIKAKEFYPGHHAVQFGQTFHGPFLRYARSRTTSASAAIDEAFWGHDQQIALLAATAYAETATPKQCDLVVKKGQYAQMFKDAAVRTYAFALHKRSPAFLPFLSRLTAHFSESGDDPFAEALSLIADIGGEDAQKILETHLFAEIPRCESDIHQMEICARAVARLGGRAAIDILERAIAATQEEKWQLYLEITRDSISPDADQRLTVALKKYYTSDIVLRALADAASFGRLPSEAVMSALKRLASHLMISHGFDLAILERHRVDAGEPLRLGKPLHTIAANMLAQLRNAKQGSQAWRGMVLELPVILDVLGRGHWKPGRRLFEEIMDDRTLPPEVGQAAIAAAGYLLEATSDSAMLARLENILYDADANVDAEEVTLAIGRIDLEALYQKRGARTAASTLQQIAAERDLLVFDDRWVDRDGTIRRWSIPPRKVLCEASEDRYRIVEAVRHELSRFHLLMDWGWPADDSVALVIIEPLPAKAQKLSKTDLLLLEDAGGKVYRIPAKANVKAARELARDIGKDIDHRLRRL